MNQKRLNRLIMSIVTENVGKLDFETDLEEFIEQNLAAYKFIYSFLQMQICKGIFNSFIISRG